MSSSTDLNTSSNTSNSKASKQIFTVEEIHQLLPHRYPFALVDRIVEFVPGEKAVGIKNVTFNEPYFPGHIPNRPIMPGVMMIEAMAQVGGVILAQLPGMQGKFFAFAGIDKASFRRPVTPGDRLIMTVELLSFKRKRIAKMKGKGMVDDLLVVEGEMLFSLFE